MLKRVCFLFLLSFNCLCAENELTESRNTTTHTVTIDGTSIPYEATTGTLILKDETGKAKASIFYIAYEKQNVQDYSKRPITFCFNGGPGSSSVWLHMGAFGPKRLALDENGNAPTPCPIADNPYSILDITDLVFIDPVSTGYSIPAPGEEAKQFHGYEEDLKSIADFIRLYTTREERWDSPKYLAGESYGTTRASGLTGELHDKYHLNLNGVIFISSILNFQTLNDYNNGNDLPYILYLPSYTATALYHEKLAPELQKNFQKTLSEVEHFALTDYTLALMQGDKLDPKTRQTIMQKIARYTALSPEFIDRSRLRINPFQYAKEFLRTENKTIGRFDSCYTGIDLDGNGEYCESDPSKEAFLGAFSSAFNHYIRDQLKWSSDQEYKILAHIPSWNYGKSNQYLNSAETLRETMAKNPHLRVFVANGYYDLATPYFGTHYTFNHLNLDPSRLTLKDYPGGHMMYLHNPNLIQLKKDLAGFFKNP